MNDKSTIDYTLAPIGFIRSVIKHKDEAPLFYDKGAPTAFLELIPKFVDGFFRLKIGDEIIVLTWLHQGDRSVLQVHPRGDKANPVTGVFLTRSPDRPNPIGLHRAKILKIDSNQILLDAIEAIDGTPVVDLKPIVHANDD